MPAQTPQVEMYTNHFLAGGAHATNVLGERIIYAHATNALGERIIYAQATNVLGERIIYAQATNALGERIIYNIHHAYIHRVQVHGYGNTFFTSPSWHNREPAFIACKKMADLVADLQ